MEEILQYSEKNKKRNQEILLNIAYLVRVLYNIEGNRNILRKIALRPVDGRIFIFT
jgi:hypothetical protein